MRVLITTTGNSLDSPIDPQFGRAKKFLLVESDNGSFEIVDNMQNLEAVQGAGIQAAQTAAQKGAQVVITGHCGPKAFRTLQEAGIPVVVGAAGTVRDALDRYKRGELKQTDKPDVQGHWS